MTQLPRLFVSAPLAAGVSVPLSAPQSHYLGPVMRRHEGDPILAFNGRDGEFRCRLEAAGRAGFTLRAETLTREQVDEPGPWLVFALLKRDATDLVIQKATELGASAILPALTARTNAARANEDRLRAIAVEAAEQSERLTVPVIHPPAPLARILDAWPPDRTLFAAIERSDAPPLRFCGGPAGLLVGPEGGFTRDELDGLGRSRIVRGVSLGPRVLRAETACIAGLALLQAPECG